MTGEIHVAHVVHSLEVGGLENGVVNLVNEPAPFVRHSIICLKAAGALQARLAPQVDVHVVGKRRGHDPRAFLRLVQLLRRLRPHLSHSRNWGTFDAVLAARLARVPVVVHGEHGREISDPDGLNTRRNRVRRLGSRLIDRFVVVSDDLGRWLTNRVGIPAPQVVRIHNGVDTVRFAPDPDPAIRGRLGLPLHQMIIGTVARLDAVKGHPDLLEAFARLGPAGSTVLAIVGDGPCRQQLEGQARTLGIQRHVHFLGERQDVPDLLKAMDVFVLPSLAEGMSNTLLEAMASGLPVVATRVGGNPELVEDDVNGLLVPPRDPAALTATIARYLEDPHLRTLHGKASRQRAVETFSLERMRSTYRGLYGRLLTPSRGN